MIIEYGNVYSAPSFDNLEEQEQFEQLLSKKEYNKYYDKEYTHQFYLKNHRFLSGLIPYLQRKLTCEIKVNNFTNGEIIDKVSLPNIKLRDYQDIAVKKNIYYKRGINNLVTGAGKTAIAAATAFTLSKKTLFVVHTTNLAEQTVEEFIKFGFSENDVGLYSANIKNLNRKYTVALVQSLYSAIKSKNTHILNFLNEVEVLFIDEAHHNSAYSYMEVIKRCNAEYRYGLSGSVFIDDNDMTTDSFKLVGATGSIINTINYDYLRSLGYLSESRCFFYKLPKHSIACDVNNYSQSYKDGIVENEARNNYIVSIAKDGLEAKQKVIIVVKHINHGHILIKKLKSLFNISSYFYMGGQIVNLYNEETDSIEDLNQNYDNIPISRFKTIDSFILILSPAFFEGIDIPNISVVIRADAGRSKKNDYQIIGRGLRLKENNLLTVIDFTDEFNFLFKYQSIARQKNYTDLGLQFKII